MVKTILNDKNSQVLEPKIVNGVPEVTVQSIYKHLGQIRLIDVRRPDEFYGEMGHIHGAELVTLGEDLKNFLNNGDREQEIVFVCRSGARSGQATDTSVLMGYKKTANLVGGMLLWNQLKLPIEK